MSSTVVPETEKTEESDVEEQAKTEEIWVRGVGNLSIWKRFIKIPYYPTWMYMLILLGYVQACSTIYSLSLIDAKEISTFADNFQGLYNFTNALFFVDIIFQIVCKNISQFFVCPLQIRSPSWILCLEMFSTLPVDLFVEANPTTLFKVVLYYLIKFKNCLKILRLINVFRYHQNVMKSQKTYMALLEIACYLNLAVLVMVAITYSEMQFKNLTKKDYSKVIYISVIQLTGYGYMEYPNTTKWMAYSSCIGLTFFVMIHYFKALLIWIAVETNVEWFKFRNRYHLIQSELKRLEISKPAINKITQFYDTCWRLENIYVENWKNLSILPSSINEELSVEVCWFAFMHSKLFRNFSLPFLRLLSMFVQSEMKMAGEIIFDKGSIKNKMIYVQSGVIQILSEEDDETPIFSFSGGTCIGETGLILPYKSNTTVRCKTSCWLHVLYQKDYVKAVDAYSKEFIYLRNEFYKRLDQAKENQSLSNIINKEYSNDRTNYVTVMWLKSTLHKLMVKDKTTLEKHVCQNVFLRDEFDEDKFKDRHFTADNLDLIAISERLELVTDSVFLKSSCPCILQPNSILLVFWNSIIAILACTAGIVVPYYACLETVIPIWYELYIRFITIMWWIDFYVQISTAVKTPDKIIATIRTIFEYRMSTFSFLLDIVAAIPLEMFSTIILTNVDRKNIVLIELNRVIKVHKLHGIYKNWKEKITSKYILITYCWYELCCLYIAYMFSCFLYHLKSGGELVGEYKKFGWYFFVTVQIINGVGVSNPFSRDPDLYPGYITICVIAQFMYLFYFTYIKAIYSMTNLDVIKLNDLYKNIFATVNSNKFISIYGQRIVENIRAQLVGSSGYQMIYGFDPYIDLPLRTYNKFAQEVYESVLCAVSLFKNLPKEVILELCNYCQNITIPPNEALCCTGQILDYFIILESGYCYITSPLSSGKKKVKATRGFSILETYTCSPVVNTVVTETHCRIVTITHSDCIKVFTKFPLQKSLIDNSLEDVDAINQLAHLYHLSQMGSEYKYVFKTATTESFKLFGYNLPLDSFEEYDYYVPFDRLRNFSFIQYFLMRSTVLPNGKFLLRWELGRCFCAVTSAVIFSLINTNISKSWVLYVIMMCLDGMAWADIYVRFHVCYYDQNGILVSHPLATAKYYLKHSFITDVLGVFPLNLIINTNNPQILTSLQLNRFLQMYRFLGFCQHAVKSKTISIVCLLLLQYIPFLLAFVFFLSYFVVTNLCSITVLESNSQITCSSNSWPVFNNFVNPLTPLRLQLYGVYFVSSIVTRSGMHGFSIMSTDSAISVVVLTVIKNILMLYLFCQVTKLYTTQVSTLWNYQNSMSTVVRFMQKFKVSPYLQDDLIGHFELKWFRFKGTNVSTTISVFQNVFKQDILYDIYGQVLENSLIFPCNSDSRHFFRSLLLEVSHDIITKNGFVTKINDVTKYLNIIYKGKASVIAADGTRIALLTPGSMFGNLIECERTRQTVTVEAIGHIEILVVETTTFYQILKKYNRLYNRYKRLTGFHTDFIKSKANYQTVDDVGQERSKKHSSLMSLIDLNLFSRIVFNPENVWLKAWKIIILVLICYLEVACTLYQIALGEYNLMFVIFQYVCDILYICNHYVKTHTGYEDEEGVIVYNLQAIRQHLATSKKETYLEIVCLVPLDVFAWFSPAKYFRIVHSILRLNRPLRFLFIYIYLKQVGNMLHINSVFTRALRMFVWSTFVCHTFTTLTILISCSLTVNMQPHHDCNAISTSSEKFTVYINYSYIICAIFTGASQSLLYPVHSVLVVYFSLVIIIAAILRSIILGQIYAVLQMYYDQRNSYQKDIDIIQNNMNQEQISPALHTKITNYLQLLWRTEKGNVYPKLLKEAPYYLREAILNDAFSDHINFNPIFAKCHRDFNRQIVSFFKIETFFKGDYVVFTGTINGCMYFINSGTVSVIKNDQHIRSKITKVKKGSCFGLAQGIFIGKPYIHSFQALQTTTILILKFDTWKHLLDFYPASRNTIYEQYFLYDDLYA